MTTVSLGSRDATRRFESLSEDTQDHLRGHLNGRISSTTTTTDAEPTRGTEEGRRDRGHRESHANVHGAAAPVREVR